MVGVVTGLVLTKYTFVLCMFIGELVSALISRRKGEVRFRKGGV